MKVVKNWILPALAGLSVLALLNVGCGGGAKAGSGGGDALVTVNGETISIADFHKYLETKGTVRVVTENGQVGTANVAETLGFQGLQDLIQQRLVLQMAKDEGVVPTEDELLKEIDFQKERNPDFLKNLTGQGLSMEDIKERITIDLAREKLITKGIKVTRQDAEKYVKDNPSQFINPATADCLVIFVRTEANRTRVDQELARGQSFSLVAQRFSQLPGAKADQRYPIREIERMPTEIRVAIEKASSAQQTGWVRLSDGFAKFYVQNKTAKSPIKMDDTKYEVVRRQLALEKGVRARDLDTTLLQKYKAAKIDVKYDGLKDLYKTFDERLKKADTETDASGNAK